MSARVRGLLLAIGAIGVVLAAPAAGQEIEFSPAATEACLSRSFNSVTCIGVSAEACIATPEGYSNVGRALCYQREYEYWSERLDSAYAQLREEALVADPILPAESLLPRQGPALAALETQFPVYRDAFCTFEDSTWGGGTGSHSAVRQCQMTLTALQALMLERGFEVH